MNFDYKKKHFRPILLINNYLTCTVKKPSNYDSVRIDLLNFTACKNVKSFLELYFVEKNNFFKREIAKLPERWQRIIEQNLSSNKAFVYYIYQICLPLAHKKRIF